MGRLVAIIVVLSMGSSLAAEPAGELVVITNAHRSETLSAAALESLFLRKVRHWPDGVVVLPLNLAPDNVVRQAFDRAVLGMDPDEVARYWLDQRIRDGTSAPREVADAAVIVKLVAHFDGAISYVPATTALAGVVIVARIKGGKVVPP